MTRVDFLRHGETEAGDALLGRTDPALSAAGRETVLRQFAGRRWPVIVSSPLHRARETAEIAARESGATIEIDPAWREIDFGDWDGRSRQDLAGDARVAEFYANAEANPPPNGEAMDQVRIRITHALERLALHTVDPVLVVAHGGSLRMALAVLLGLPLERLWAIRIDYATRVSVEMGSDPTHGLWGEIIEIAQPVAGETIR
jgi:alpha-ribazole phosphatase